MSILSTVMAITILVMVTFNCLDFMNKIYASEKRTYQSYWQIQMSLNAQKSSTISKKHKFRERIINETKIRKI